MPELPEVETVVRTLEKQVGHATITSVKVLWDNIISNVAPSEFERMLRNQTFKKYDRRGKFLVFTLSDYVMIAHLRMEGKFYYYKEDSEALKHTHVIFQLAQGQLHYNDVRKFGKFYLYPKGSRLEVLEKLGYEPFDEKLTASYLKEYCHNNKTEIKTALLDQSMISGIGNIYANEICFDAKINPYRPAGLISLQKWDQIIKSTSSILAQAIKAGGTTIRSYTSSLGVTGLFQQSLYVHGKDKEKCLVCGNEIIKTKLNGRGTYYCPCCQKQKPVSIAITGSMGSGKSAVRKMIEEMGYSTISCDDVNRELLNQPRTISALAEIFQCEESIIDKTYISKRIFSQPDIKKRVEAYLHNQIGEEIKKWAKEHEDEKYLFVEVPLLFETDWYYYFDVNIDVYCNENLLIERLEKYRGYSPQQSLERLASQMDIEEKKSRADYIINNESSLDKLAANVEKVVGSIVKL